jgi:hypothetical protein
MPPTPLQVLQDALSGTSKVLLVCNLSPEGQSASETLSSLNFASRAAQVELGQARRTADRDGSGTAAAASINPGTPKAASAVLAGGAFASERPGSAGPGCRSPLPGMLGAPPPSSLLGGKTSKPAGMRSSVRDSISVHK